MYIVLDHHTVGAIEKFARLLSHMITWIFLCFMFYEWVWPSLRNLWRRSSNKKGKRNCVFFHYILLELFSVDIILSIEENQYFNQLYWQFNCNTYSTHIYKHKYSFDCYLRMKWHLLICRTRNDFMACVRTWWVPIVSFPLLIYKTIEISR